MLDFLLFQFQWWLCVLHKYPYFYYGYILAFSSAVLSLFLKYRSPFHKKILFAAGLATIGMGNDILLAYLKIFELPGLWLAALWFCFAAWFVEAEWINQKKLLCTVSFMILGPLSYIAGAKLNALVFLAFSYKTLFLLALDWLILGLVFTQVYRN